MYFQVQAVVDINRVRYRNSSTTRYGFDINDMESKELIEIIVRFRTVLLVYSEVYGERRLKFSKYNGGFLIVRVRAPKGGLIVKIL